MDGSTIVAGARGHTVGGNHGAGAVYVFSEPAAGWANRTQTAELTASNGAAGDSLGGSVAVDGSTIVAGAPGQPNVSYNSSPGVVYVFSEPAGAWANATQTAELTASDRANSDGLGQSVAVDGSTIAAGAPNHRVGGNRQQGAVYVFSEPAGGWSNASQTSELTDWHGVAENVFGYSVAVSGSAITVGAHKLSAAGPNSAGAVYVLGPARPTVTSLKPDEGPVSSGTEVTVTGTNFVAGATVMFGSTPASSVTFVSGTQLTAIAPAGAPGSVDVTVGTPTSASAVSPKDLYAYGPPTIGLFTPSSGVTGSYVKITGTAFASGLVVWFGTLRSPNVIILSATQLEARVPNGDPGPSTITISDVQGRATSTSQFAPTLSITGFTPISAAPGTVVTVTGLEFNSSSVVAFHGLAAPTSLISSTELQAIVPAGASSGSVKVTETTTPTGTFTSRNGFTVT